ncbi:MAG: outer membrane lipoprotein carrier protein LolA [Elusimicrobia bacterium]|nr:outer membrane lipoprotein carrier protein LolA [Elusimicrobiota bacterium]
MQSCKIKTLRILLLCGLLPGLHALGHASPVWTVELLSEKLQSKATAAMSVQLTFTQEVSYPDIPAQPLTLSGTLWARPTDQFRIEYGSPQGSLTLSDGKTVWSYFPEDRLAYRISWEKWRKKQELPRWFLNASFYLDLTQNYTLRIDTQTEQDLWLSLTPKETTAPFVASAQLRKRDLQILRVKLQMENFQSLLQIHSIEENPTLTDSLFRFKAPRGTTILNLLE